MVIPPYSSGYGQVSERKSKIMVMKVLILFCGGTIIMTQCPDGSLAVPGKEEAVRLLQEIEPHLSDIAEYQIDYVENIDSTNMDPKKWDRILHQIEVHYHAYDGFVITHGTDTMAYTAAALSLAIHGLGKPILLTGSQIPGSELYTDARRNLVNAMRLATMDLSGVYIVFDERIIEGRRASKASESKLDAFTSVNAEDAGEIRVHIRLAADVPGRRSSSIQIFPGFEANIFVYTLTPGCDPDNLTLLLQDERIRGMILRAYGTGNIPDRFEPFFRKAWERQLPIVVTSQCLYGKTMMGSYSVGKAALDLGVIDGGDQSLETLAVKLMWALKRYPYEGVRTVIERP
jgi:L-asparaginase